MQSMQNCRCPHHSMMGLFITLIALTILSNHLGFLSDGTSGIVWPVLLGLIGLQKGFNRMCKCCSGCGCGCGDSNKPAGKCC